ncbi:MAG: Fe-S protein maturation auxiliary factor SufT [Calditrichaeota bacterium]|nr:Fe-S protein maturation auxiliary factor SufT [Calditrichota bacterium]
MPGSNGLTPDKIYDALASVIDPELNINIVDLGLIYDIKIDENDEVHLIMTLTTMGCPIGPQLAKDVEQTVLGVEGVKDVLVEVTFEPPWNMNMMSDFAKDALGIG